jgi:hypothetical protein
MRRFSGEIAGLLWGNWILYEPVITDPSGQKSISPYDLSLISGAPREIYEAAIGVAVTAAPARRRRRVRAGRGRTRRSPMSRSGVRPLERPTTVI